MSPIDGLDSPRCPDLRHIRSLLQVGERGTAALQAAAGMFQILPAMAVGEHPEVADPHEVTGQQVLQKAADELFRR